jgi:muconolactone delta-isomerase
MDQRRIFGIGLGGGLAMAGLAVAWAAVTAGPDAAPGANASRLAPAAMRPATPPRPALAEAEGEVDFARDVLPILSNSCYLCHGPDQESEEAKDAGFRLDLRDEAIAFEAIVPGDADASILMDVITSTRSTRVMPPPESHKPRLTEREVELLRRWIEQGAAYTDHWAFVPPRLPDLPDVSDPGWCRSDIDRFVLARLDEEGMSPSAEADRRRLIRRVYLDLIGLPPTPAQVQAFVDDTAPDAYERVVDTLLASEHFGEHWARQWLDKARYADSKGFEADRARVMWRYRDWVIDAYNCDMPFDRFTREQIAGDLLDDPTLDQLIATGFHRNTKVNDEGGTDDEEFRSLAVIDRVNTTMEVWMGLTAGCAQCHTHKYDPLYHQEYFELYAFFNQTADADRNDEQPKIPAPTPEQAARIGELEAEIAAMQRGLLEPGGALAAAQHGWEQQALAATTQWQPLRVTDARSANGATLTRQRDGSLLVRGDQPETDVYTIEATTDLTGITAVRLEALTDERLPGPGPGRTGHGNFVLSHIELAAEPSGRTRAPVGRYVRIDLPGDGRILSLAEVEVYTGDDNIALGAKASQSSTDFAGPAFHAVDGNTDGDFNNTMTVTHTATEADPWWEVDLGEPRTVDHVVLHNRTDNNLHTRLNGARVSVLDADHKVVWQTTIPTASAEPMRLATTGPVRVTLQNPTATFEQQDYSAAKAIDGEPGGTFGWAVGTRQGEDHAAVFETAGDLGFVGGTDLRFILHQVYGQQHTLGRFRLMVTDAPRPVRLMPADIRAILATPADQRSDEQAQALTAYYIAVAPEAQRYREQIAELERELQQLRGQVPTALVMRELPEGQHRTTYLFLGGSFLAPDTERGPLEPGTPAFLHGFPEDAPNNRLGLAQWLTAPDNPLTARVQVNRVWEEFFGLGIVETTEDFGFQGSYPSHPELLDYLAVQFQTEMGWSMKSLIRAIVTSATYRQTSAVDAERLERDRYNRLLSRGPRMRLNAEQIRDQALAVAGLLHHEVGGPSVLPYVPDGLLPQAFDSFVQQTSSGDTAIYRRGLYTAWRRTGHYPSFAAFDAPDRSVCTIKRAQTNTPLQALVTLNDPVYVEAAQALGRRLIDEVGDEIDARLQRGFQLALAREASPEEATILRDVYDAALAEYRNEPDEAMKMATDPRGPLPDGVDAADAAAMTVVCNVILNLDEFLNKP